MSDKITDPQEPKPEMAEAKASSSEIPSVEELAKLRETAAKAEEYLDLAKRTKADYLNYQDRVRREKESLSKYAVEGFAREFLCGLDAVRESVRLAKDAADPKRLLEGVELIEREFLRVLSVHGITPIDCLGRAFDPVQHEVLAVVEEGEGKPNSVVEEVRRGWRIHDRVLRPALVKILK